METRYPRPSALFVLSVLLVVLVVLGAVVPVTAASVPGTDRPTPPSAAERVTQAEAVEVTGLNAPAEATVGASISVEATVRNGGDASSTASLEYRIGNRVVATAEVTLAAGESRTVTLEGVVPELDPGSYQQGVFVDGTGNGRTASLTVRGPAVASFAVSDFRGPVQVRSGGRITAEAVVQNAGDAAGSTTLEYRIGEETIARRSVELGPGASRTLTLEGTVPDLGTGTYAQGVFVGNTSQGQTTSIVVEGAPTPTPTPTDRGGPGFTLLLDLLALLAVTVTAVAQGRRE